MEAFIFLSLTLAVVVHGEYSCETLVREHCGYLRGIVTEKMLAYEAEHSNNPMLNETIRVIVQEEIKIALQILTATRIVEDRNRHVMKDINPWIVFQRRNDGSENFYRGWNDYVNGFGNETGEFWLGLENIHQVTSSDQYELRIDMIAENGDRWSATYSSFKIGPASDNYRLHVSGYCGNATDSFANPYYPDRSHDNEPFSTYDSDHDNWWYGNCASTWKGGWWYDNCFDSNFNGMYGMNTPEGIVWVDQGRRTNMFLTFTEMKMRVHY